MKITKIITRRVNFHDYKCWITTNSIKSDYDGKWSNCLYLHFAKENFPQLKYPELIEIENPTFGWMKRRYEYESSDLNRIDFHGGITYYEETYNAEDDKTYIKVGCDYQHLWDDDYREDDFGEEIIKYDGIKIVEQFMELVKAQGET